MFGKTICKKCHKLIDKSEWVCPYCGTVVDDSEDKNFVDEERNFNELFNTNKFSNIKFSKSNQKYKTFSDNKNQGEEFKDLKKMLVIFVVITLVVVFSVIAGSDSSTSSDNYTDSEYSDSTLNDSEDYLEDYSEDYSDGYGEYDVITEKELKEKFLDEYDTSLVSFSGIEGNASVLDENEFDSESKMETLDNNRDFKVEIRKNTDDKEEPTYYAVKNNDIVKAVLIDSNNKVIATQDIEVTNLSPASREVNFAKEVEGQYKLLGYDGVFGFIVNNSVDSKVSVYEYPKIKNNQNIELQPDTNYIDSLLKEDAVIKEGSTTIKAENLKPINSIKLQDEATMKSKFNDELAFSSVEANNIHLEKMYVSCYIQDLSNKTLSFNFKLMFSINNGKKVVFVDISNFLVDAEKNINLNNNYKIDVIGTYANIENAEVVQEYNISDMVEVPVK